jgi:hypothetical protein
MPACLPNYPLFDFKSGFVGATTCYVDRYRSLANTGDAGEEYTHNPTVHSCFAILLLAAADAIVDKSQSVPIQAQLSAYLLTTSTISDANPSFGPGRLARRTRRKEMKAGTARHSCTFCGKN